MDANGANLFMELMKDVQFRNEYHRLLANLHFTHGRIVNELQQKLTPYGLSAQQYAILKVLLDVYPNTMTVSDVKEQMVDRNSDMTRLVDRLVSKKIVVREVDEQNRRQVNLRLSESAYPLVKEVQEQFRNFEAIIDHLTNEEVATLNALLDKIRNK